MAEKIRLGYGALSSDTELLTPTGWTNIKDVTEETLVAQYSIDGYIRKSEHFRCEYCNIRKPAIDRGQAVATLAGYKTCLGIVPHEDDPSRQISYKLSINSRSKSTQGDSLITETIDYNDLMYGVRVDTNMLIVRRNDAVSITGCGNMLLLKDPVINTDCGHLV